MLTSETAKRLYMDHAQKMPIIDYHCHLVPEMIAENYRFRNITDAWLGGDHYKWRAMRANGVDEKYITGKETGDYEKFEKWAATVPYTMRNPLYHWTHLELSQIFGINTLLNLQTARDIYIRCNEFLASEEYRAQAIMKRFHVEMVCTTDDPIDTLLHHQKIKEKNIGIKVLPTWRADKAMAVESASFYNNYLNELGKVSNIEIGSYRALFEALRKRQLHFKQNGCLVSDHGLETFYAETYTEKEIEVIFSKIRKGDELTCEEIAKYKSAVLFDLAVMDAEAGWVQQFHIGAIRNNNTSMFHRLGPDTGYDAIHDLPTASAGHRFFNRLTLTGKLAKTIIYNLNPKDNEVFATMAYTFNDGSVPGKMQLGSGWWFLDQEDGMRKQLNALSSLGLLSRFVGMLTDSRSFLSYPRHDYFRRILCDIVGLDIESGRLPKSEINFIGKIIENISYYNIKEYLINTPK